MTSERLVAVLSESYEGHEPKTIREPTKELDDPAVEKTITLFRLVQLLESIKGRDFPRTIFFGIMCYSTEKKLFPEREAVAESLRRVQKVLDGDPEYSVFNEFPHYDVMGVVFQDPSAYDEEIVSGERIYTGESPYFTLYPAPALVGGVFNRDYSESDREPLVRFFLEGDYADRVIFLPRMRYRGGVLDSEIIYMMQELIPEIAPYGDPEPGILPGKSIFDLAEIPDKELLRVGIPVFRLEEGA